MSKMKDRLIADVRSKFGDDGARAVDYLFSNGTLDDTLARNHLVKVEMFTRLLTTKRSKRQLEEDIAEDFCISRERVFQITG